MMKRRKKKKIADLKPVIDTVLWFSFCSITHSNLQTKWDSVILLTSSPHLQSIYIHIYILQFQPIQLESTNHHHPMACSIILANNDYYAFSIDSNRSLLLLAYAISFVFLISTFTFPSSSVCYLIIFFFFFIYSIIFFFSIYNFQLFFHLFLKI